MHPSASSNDQLNLHMCMNNKTIAVQILSDSNDYTTCRCQATSPAGNHIREDYAHTPGIGSHKLHIDAKSWNEARKICNKENGHLAIINSRDEEAVSTGFSPSSIRSFLVFLNSKNHLFFSL